MDPKIQHGSQGFVLGGMEVLRGEGWGLDRWIDGRSCLNYMYIIKYIYYNIVIIYID